jgi:hypothetical protein
LVSSFSWLAAEWRHSIKKISPLAGFQVCDLGEYENSPNKLVSADE